MIVHNVEQRTQEWLDLRLGKITSTTFKKVVGKDWKKYIYSLIADEALGYAEENDFLSPAMEWGLSNEPFAAEEYEKQTGFQLLSAGFIQPDTIPYIGLSPDRYYMDGERIIGIEFKCPDTKKHIEIIHTNTIPSEWENQVHFWFLMDENIVQVDFVSFDPRFTKRPLHVIPTIRPDVDVRGYSEKLAIFRSEWERVRKEVAV